jgi:lipoprotein-releasing system permease protein
MWVETLIALRFLREGRAQTTMIVTGIAVGVAVIVFIIALITGLQDNIIERTLGTQAHIRVLPPQEVNHLVTASSDTVQLLLEDKRPQRLRSIINWQQVQSTLDALPGVRAVSPSVTGPGFARKGDAVVSVAILGIDPDRYRRIIPLDKSITSGLLRVDAGEVVIGQLLADDLGLRVGDKLRLQGVAGRSSTLNVVGIFSLGVREVDQRFVYLGMQPAQSLLDLAGGATVIEVTVQDIFAAQTVAQRISALLSLRAESWMQTNAQLMNALRSQTLSTLMIAVFVAVSVAFGIASVLSVSVQQRTREIGILRAMGTRRQQMLRVFLLQGAVLGFGGSLVGALSGYGLVWMFNVFGPRLFYIPVAPVLVPAAMALATLTGMISAVAPARRAAWLAPVEAIRHV